MTSLGRKKTESNFLANFPRTISQTSSLFRRRQHKWKIRDNTRGIVYDCSDLTCTKKYKYALTEGTKWRKGGGGRINVAYSLSPLVIFCLLRPTMCCCVMAFSIACVSVAEMTFILAHVLNVAFVALYPAYKRIGRSRSRWWDVVYVRLCTLG